MKNRNLGNGFAIHKLLPENKIKVYQYTHNNFGYGYTVATLPETKTVAEWIRYIRPYSMAISKNITKKQKRKALKDYIQRLIY